ncbi:MAG: energy transducer TonB [Pseudomonadota bacterium]
MHIFDDNKPELFPYLLASILLHILLVGTFTSGLIDIKLPELKEEVLEVIPLTDDGGQYRIADIDRPSVEKRPDKARFLGSYDSSVEKEIVAMTRRKGSPDGAKTPKKSDGLKRSLKAKKGSEGSIYNFEHELFAMKAPAESLKTEESSSQVAGSEALEDFYPDYTIGPHTYLNVLRYPDIDYFVRMKRQFKMTFNPIPSLKQHFSGNQVAQGTVNVVLAVSVEGGGNISELFVIQSSGIPTYDQEALRTVRASSPFASPPEKFLEDDGILRMSWTFTVYL